MKNKKMKKYSLILLALVPQIFFAQVDRAVKPKAGPAPQINIKDSEVFTLKNGLTVILSENHKIPRVTYSLTIGSDPKPEGNKAGLGEITGELIMSGTTNKDKDQLDKEIDYIGANLSASFNSLYMSSLTKHSWTCAIHRARRQIAVTTSVQRVWPTAPSSAADQRP